MLRTRRVRPHGRRWPENPNSAPIGGPPVGVTVSSQPEKAARSFHIFRNIVRIILYRPAGLGPKGFRTIVFFIYFLIARLSSVHLQATSTSRSTANKLQYYANLM